jgi:hypothetical protein
MFPSTHSAPHPPRVTGPMQITPCTRKQVSVSNFTSKTRLIADIVTPSGLLSFRLQVSHRDFADPNTEPGGGSFP